MSEPLLNEGVLKREVFGWALYDFANSGYTTVVLTAVFNAYFVAVVADGAAWGTLAWTLAIAASSLIAMLTLPALGAHADRYAAKKKLLAFSTVACVLATVALADAGRGDLWLAVAAVIAAGLHGVEKGLKLTAPPITGTNQGAENIPRAPRSLLETTKNFRASEIARDWLGDTFVEHFAATREWEWRQWLDGVTDWELKRYFEII